MTMAGAGWAISGGSESADTCCETTRPSGGTSGTGSWVETDSTTTCEGATATGSTGSGAAAMGAASAGACEGRIMGDGADAAGMASAAFTADSTAA